MINAPKEITPEELRAIKLADAERTMRESYSAWPNRTDLIVENMAGNLVNRVWTAVILGMFIAAPILTANCLMNKDSALERSKTSYSISNPASNYNPNR